MGTYYGVVRWTSPTYVRATFTDRNQAQAFINQKPDPESWRIVEF